jgi:hypothetical protein
LSVSTRPWARRWEYGPPQAKFYIHPTLNNAELRPREPQRLEMLLEVCHPFDPLLAFVTV